MLLTVRSEGTSTLLLECLRARGRGVQGCRIWVMMSPTVRSEGTSTLLLGCLRVRGRGVQGLGFGAHAALVPDVPVAQHRCFPRAACHACPPAAAAMPPSTNTCGYLYAVLCDHVIIRPLWHTS